MVWVMVLDLPRWILIGFKIQYINISLSKNDYNQPITPLESLFWSKSINLSFAIANLKLRYYNRINLQKLNFAIDKKKKKYQVMRFQRMV